jgi:hypothetical protein
MSILIGLFWGIVAYIAIKAILDEISDAIRDDVRDELRRKGIR